MKARVIILMALVVSVVTVPAEVRLAACVGDSIRFEGAGLVAQVIAPFLLRVRFLPDFDADGILNLLGLPRPAVL